MEWRVIILSVFLNSCRRISGQFIKPLHIEFDGSRLIYDNVAAVLYRFQIPEWIDSDFLVTGVGSCSNPTSDSWCPSYFYMQEIRNILQPFLTFAEYRNIPVSEERQSWSNPLQNCQEIRPHFRTQHISTDRFNAYKLDLQNCLTNDLIIEKPVLTQPDLIKSEYSAAHIAYSLAYYDSNPHPNIENAAHSIENSMMTLAGIHHYMIEANKWVRALSSCKSLKLPNEFVPTLQLQKDLSDLRIFLEAENMEESIRGFSMYYDLPLVDCTFIESNTELVVRLLIPVKYNHYNWSYTQTVQPILFHHIYNSSPYICQTSIINGNYFWDNLSGYIRKASCLDGVLCYSGAEQASWRKDCQYISLNASSTDLDIITLCPLYCEPMVNFNTPTVQRIGKGAFYITGSPTDPIRIVCVGELDEIIFPPQEGVLEVHLPCGCSVQTLNNPQYKVQQPCTLDPKQYNQLLPLHFKTLSETNNVVIFKP